MNTDIRLSVGFWTHPKTKKLERHLGLEGIRSLQILWCWAAQNRPDGNLSGYDPDGIEGIADWEGESGAFYSAIIGKWLDVRDDGLWVHDWLQHNPRLKLFEHTKRPWSKTWKRIKMFVFRRDGYMCRYCGARVENPHCDHVYPVSRGGDNGYLNLVTACPSCNLSKGAKTIEEWSK
jgi:hypothetical protein